MFQICPVYSPIIQSCGESRLHQLEKEAVERTEDLTSGTLFPLIFLNSNLLISFADDFSHRTRV